MKNLYCLNSSGIHLVRKTCALFFIKFPWKNSDLNSRRGKQVSLNSKLEDLLFLLKSNGVVPPPWPPEASPQLMFFQLPVSPESVEWGHGGGERARSAQARPPGFSRLPNLTCGLGADVPYPCDSV